MCRELPCLLGIRHFLTHLEPLVHPKYTPAKKVTMKPWSSEAFPHPDPVARYSFAEAAPHVVSTQQQPC